ncbi:IclR family transcriptional regulator [Geminicoccaceae bacterium 1502E]|nr:IclR family transcriptional regulator [Geminicoccaceae bacterium 1502E]
MTDPVRATVRSTAAVDRCLELLALLAGHPRGLPLSDIAERMDLPKSAAHRLLHTLIEQGFAMQGPGRAYRLTMRLVQLGFSFLAGSRLLELAQPILDRLAEEAGELVRLTVVEGERIHWIGKAQGARGSLLLDPVMGAGVQLHATATGKVWLASLPVETALRVVLEKGFGSPAEHGPNVITSAELLLAELAMTRQRGYGIAFEEAEPGVAAVAVALRPQPGGPVAGTVSVAGPVARMPRERLDALVGPLRAAAAELEAIWPLLVEGLADADRHKPVERSPA